MGIFNKKRQTIIRLGLVCSCAVYICGLVLIPLSTARAQDNELNKRINEYKKQFNVTLSKSQVQRFKLRCGVAQTVMQNLRGEIAVVQEKRSKVYTSVTDQLTTLSTNVAQKDIDTKKLNGQLAILKEKISDFNSNIAIYKQAVEDMADMDCEADPSGFNAALSVARLAHGKLVIAVGDIRTFINNTVKLTLLQIKEQLKNQQDTNSATN